MEASLVQAAIQGIQNLLDPYVFLAIIVGVGIGTFTAVAPQGIGTPLVYAILVPIVVSWTPIRAIALLIGASAVSAICAAYLPVLFGIPGGAGSQATVLDGYPMGQRGEARRALGASFMAGGLGSLIGTLTLALAIPVAKPLIYLLGSPELFIVVLWGLTTVALLVGDRPIKGLIAAAFGLLISSVGQQHQSGLMRFVFDQIYLLDGLPLSVIALALFGVPSALDLALTRLGVEKQPTALTGSLLDGVKDTLREWWLVLRCSFVGVWVGIVPGIGAQTVDWLSYGHAAQTCKGAKDTFGKGDVRGVIAPESANDAKDGGDLITTLLLGFPQGTTTALFIVALLAMGLIPGPEMVRKNLDVIFSIVWIQGLSGIIGTLVGFALANQLAKLALVRYSIMVPIILTFIFIGAFSADRDPADLLVVVVFGAFGYCMRRWGFPRPPLILGLVLGELLERYLYRSVASYGLSWLGRPGVIVLSFLAISSLIYTLWGRSREKRPAGIKQRRISFKFKGEIFFTTFFLLLFLAALFIGWDWPLIAKLMPIYVAALPGALLALSHLYSHLTGQEERSRDIAGPATDEISTTTLDRGTELRRTLTFFAWFAGGALGVWMLGMVICLPLLVFFYSLIEGKEKWRSSFLLSGAAYLLVWGLFDYLLGIRWPAGLLLE
ncbi:MAG: tripartite tricarboxylate transporter permease [Deltaproteobacteria bacterium]|nr:MAG: tripartite tricarboxylate transporter permease [Deltaproteobacteria bacterium]